MTLIEFFDEEKIDNAVGTLLLRPKRTVFLFPEKRDESFLKALGDILEKRGIETELVAEVVNLENEEEAMVQVEEIVKRYPDADFDIAGGNDVMLVTMGLLAKKYNLPMHMAKPDKKTVTYINSDKKAVIHDDFLTVEELIMLYGGKCSNDSREEETYSWNRNNEREEEILNVWNICKSDPGAWNAAIGVMRGYRMDKKNVLTMIWSKLKRDNLVKREGNVIRYKSSLVKYLLTKQGTALEMFTFLSGKKTNFFDDGQSGVLIDWKGKRDVENEIDVLFTRGFTGYFISCKNGMVDSDELYKLSVVAKRFGGRYAKKILVISYFEPDRSFMERAEELGIKVIKNTKHLSDKDLGKKLTM